VERSLALLHATAAACQAELTPQLLLPVIPERNTLRAHPLRRLCRRELRPGMPLSSCHCPSSWPCRQPLAQCSAATGGACR
jgi:hypothetical protein